MNRLLLTLPSRGRPDRINEMLRSFEETKSPGTDIVIVLDKCDPRLSEYRLDGYKVEIRDRQYVAQIHNYIVQSNPGYSYYMPVNDDIIFRTPGWDSKMIKLIESRGGWGIAYGDDKCGNTKWELPTFGMVSANIVNELGYVYPRELRALFGDTFLLDLGRAIGRLFYADGVVIEHIRKIDYEDDYRTSPIFEKEDRLAYAKYIDTKLDKDVEKVFNSIVSERMLQGV